MSELPAGWTRQPLEEVATVVMGQSPPGSSYNTQGRGVPFFQGKADFRAEVASVRVFTTAGTKFAAEGDILFSVRAPVGPSNVSPCLAVIGRGLAAIRAKDGVDQRYLHWAIRASAHILAGAGAGTTFPAVTGGQVRSHPVNVAPLDEQRRIVDTLEDHLSRLDAAENSLDANLIRLEAVRESFLWSDPSIKSAPSRPLMQLLSSPLANGRSVPTAADGFPVLRLTALTTAGVDLTQKKTGAWTRKEAQPFLVQGGDFLVSRGNGALRLLARGGLVQADPPPTAFPDTMTRIRAYPDVINPDYLSLIWNSRIVRAQIEAAARTTAGIYKVNQRDLEAIILPLPDLPTQLRLVGALSAVTYGTAHIRHALLDTKLRATSLHTALLSAAFTGLIA